MNIIEVTKVTKQYKQGTQTIKACDDISLKIQSGEFVAIIGPSGSGKSTLLQLLGGLDSPSSGQITLRGEKISAAKEKKRVLMRRDHIGFIFQGFNLIPTLTASQNVEAAISKRSPSALSGGEQQRVAIARAIINNPEIILADEPTGNLDSKTAEEILQLLSSLNKDKHKTIILITHSDFAKRFANRTLEISDGRIIQG